MVTNLLEVVQSWASVAWQVFVAQAVLALDKTIEAAGSGSLHTLRGCILAAEELIAAEDALDDCQVMARNRQTFAHLDCNRWKIVGMSSVLSLVSPCPREQQPPRQPPIESFVYEEQEEDGTEVVTARADRRTKLAQPKGRLQIPVRKTAFAEADRNPAPCHRRAGSRPDRSDPDQTAAHMRRLKADQSVDRERWVVRSASSLMRSTKSGASSHA